MTRPKRIPTDLALAIDGELTPDEFVAAARSFFGYITEIAKAEKERNGIDGKEIEWTVKIEDGSYLIGLQPDPDTPASYLGMIHRKAKSGIRDLKKGKIEDAGLSDKAIGCLKKLSDLAENGNGTPKVNLWVHGTQVEIGSEIALQAEKGAGGEYYEYSSIEGRIKSVKEVKGGLRIMVKDILYPKEISCGVPEEMLPQVIDGFRRRVEVEGRVRYRQDDTPIHVEADLIDVFPEDKDLPTEEDVLGIMKDVR